MLKIYNAYAEHGNIKIEDYIDFKGGKFDTGLDGFGEVVSGNITCKRANYELTKDLNSYIDYLRTVKLTDGYVENFMIWNPYSYEMLEETYKDITRNFETYEEYGLNEEGILLFTDWIRLTNLNDHLVRRIFGRNPENGMYLIKPNASFSMAIGCSSSNIQENYEVLQSQNLGKHLSLTKMNRKI